ncbi:MAG TPA: hypothetical protein VJW94_14630 [Candidatus Acidoferrum sp.]|nr:hypothetical protein [Candidatus Acidoferrum sp.]
MRKAVCVSAKSSNEWALLVTVAQEFNERLLVPMIWVSGSSLISTESPSFAEWQRTGQVRVLRDSHLSPEQRTQQFINIINGAVENVAESYPDFFLHKETPSVLGKAVIDVISRFKTLPNIPVSSEPAYSWFVANKELATRTHQFLRYLALGDSGSIPAITASTPEELARREENFLLRGDHPNWRES